jgi:hypothetical protein
MKNKTKQTPLDRLKHHVSGAIERGEAVAIEAVVENKTKHTPGPWAIRGTRQYGFSIEAKSTDARFDLVTVAGMDLTLEPTCHLKQQFEANARLIAAAPEMLDALSKCIPLIARGMNEGAFNDIVAGPEYAARILASCEALIARAEGRDE